MNDDDIVLLKLLRQIAVANRGKDVDEPVSLPRTTMTQIFKLAFDGKFDEDFYLSQNADVAKAIKSGATPSALDHFAASGIYESRLPSKFPLDEEDYKGRHQDVALAIEKGEAKSATDHFLTVGFNEGRGFQLLPEVAEAASK